MIRAPRRRRRAAVVVATLGAVALVQAGWIHAKAQLGQALIAWSWQTNLGGEEGKEAARPWPWADTWPVARLQVPDRGVDVFVLEGGSGRTLAWGPGHLAGTARVGGPGNAVVAGHRDTHFAFLRDLGMGTEILTASASGTRRYRVTERFVTDERDASVIAQLPGDDRLTLVTCWPFDALVPGGPARWVVVARPLP